METLLKSFRRILSAVILLAMFSQAVFGATITVNTAAEGSDEDPGDGICEATNGMGDCTLRAAMSVANNGDTILVESDVLSVINLTLGHLQVEKEVLINGNDRAVAGDGEEELFSVAVDNVTITNFQRIYNGLYGISANNVSNLTITNNTIGCSVAECADGNVSQGIHGGNLDGLTIQNNVISGNGAEGIALSGDLIDLDISNNKIGISDEEDPANEVAVGNGGGGINLATVGTISGQIYDNTISGNSGGLHFNPDGDLGDLEIYGNMIGTNSDGTNDSLGNSGVGISVQWDLDSEGLNPFTIGKAGENPNVISGTSGNGIRIFTYETGPLSEGTIKIQNNYIGTLADGTADGAVGNTGVGISVYDGSSQDDLNIVIGNDGDGIDDCGEGNVIANNGSDGISIGSANTVRIAGNMIGVEADGVTAAPNDYRAIDIDNSTSPVHTVTRVDITSNVIGGSDAGTTIGVWGVYDALTPVVIQGNFIGLGLDGKTDIGGGSIEIDQGTVTFGGVNNLYVDGNNGGAGMSDEEFIANAFDIVGYGNIVANQYTVGLNIGHNVENNDSAYIYGNIFGLKRGDSGLFDTSASDGAGAIVVNSDGLRHLEIGAVDPDHLSSEEEVLRTGDVFSDRSQLRNIISGGFENYSVPFDPVLSVIDVCDAGVDDDCNAGAGAVINIVNNYIGIGINSSGEQTLEVPEDGGTDYGIGIYLVDGDQIQIGCMARDGAEGMDACDENSGNVISGNSLAGVLIFPISLMAEGDVPGVVRILGNYIGLNAAGDEALPNGDGIASQGAAGLYIGYTGTPGVNSNPDDVQYSRNVISGNDWQALGIQNDDEYAGETVILGNYIGLNPAGDTAIGNAGNVPEGEATGAVLIMSGNVTFGGGDLTDANKRNVVSGNYSSGVTISGDGESGESLVVSGNYIGTNALGNAAIPNVSLDSFGGGSGISVFSNAGGGTPAIEHLTIGGDTANSGNVISGNEGFGIVLAYIDEVFGYIDFADGGIKNNKIGVAADGVTVLENGDGAVFVVDGCSEGLDACITGLADAFVDNVISGGFYYLFIGESVDEVSADEYVDAIYENNSWIGDLVASLYNVMLYVFGFEEYQERAGEGGGFEGLIDAEVDVPDYYRPLPVEECVSYTYSNWGTCTNGNQTRTVVSSSPDGCSGGATLVLSQTCSTGGGGMLIGNIGGNNNTNRNVTPPQTVVTQPVVTVTPPTTTVPTQTIQQAISTVTNTATTNVTTVVNTAREVVIPVTTTAPTVTQPTSVTSETSTSESSSTDTAEPTFEPPTSRRSVNSSHVYESHTYQQAALSLILDDEEECGGEKSEKCIEDVYGIEEITEEKEAPLTEREIGDAIVFNKKPGEVITVPRITNLSGTVGSHPAILALSKANDHVVIELTKEESETTEKKSKKFTSVIKIEGDTDEEGKAVMSPKYSLSAGNYKAYIYAQRNDLNVNGRITNFTVDPAIDNEFYVTDLKVTEEDEHERIEGEPGTTVKFLLTYTERFLPRFVAMNYIEYARTGGKVYIATGRVHTTDQKNKMVYLAYKSVVFGSVVISDAEQNGTFRSKISKELVADTHDLTAYAHDPKQAKSTSLKTTKFVKKGK